MKNTPSFCYLTKKIDFDSEDDYKNKYVAKEEELTKQKQKLYQYLTILPYVSPVKVKSPSQRFKERWSFIYHETHELNGNNYINTDCNVDILSSNSNITSVKKKNNEFNNNTNHHQKDSYIKQNEIKQNGIPRSTTSKYSQQTKNQNQNEQTISQTHSDNYDQRTPSNIIQTQTQQNESVKDSQKKSSYSKFNKLRKEEINDGISSNKNAKKEGKTTHKKEEVEFKGKKDDDSVKGKLPTPKLKRNKSQKHMKYQSNKTQNPHSKSLKIDHQPLINSLLIDLKSEVEYQQLYDQDINVDHHHNLIIDHKSKVEHHYHLNDHQYESENQSENDSYSNTETTTTNDLNCIERNVDFEQTDMTEKIRQNKEMYLRWLVKISNENPIPIDEIPKEFIDVFTLPGLSQALNISYNYQPSIDYSKVEKFIDDYFKNYVSNYDKTEDNETISKFDHLAQQIKDNINSDIEKIYACFYFVTHHVQYDHERSLLKGKDRKELSIENIIEIQKGVCSDYSVLYRELVKRSGIKTEQIPINTLCCASKAAGYNSWHPPKNPDYDHESNIVKINNEYFISESTWGAGHGNDKKEFDFDYNKSYFLIPYHKGLLTHFPENIIDAALNKFAFSWNNFIDLSKPNIPKELSIESNPFRSIKVDDGFYDMQISLIQPVYRLSGELYLIKENFKIKQKDNLVTYTCLAKDLPSHQFSLSSEKRCRYKITIHFHEIGNYLLETYSKNNDKDEMYSKLFETYFEVNQIKQKSIDIEMIDNEKYSFNPIIPKTGLTKVSSGYARIRFTIKWKNSHILFDSFNIKGNTSYQYNNNNTKLYHHYFTTEIPFIKYDWEKSNDFLVENWVLIKFPENGKWKIDLYFQNEGKNSYSKGASYNFEVEGSEKKCPSPLFDLPKNRRFAPFIPILQKKIWTNPPTNTVICFHRDFYFHLFGDKDLSAYFKYEDGLILRPKLIKKKKSSKENYYDYEYSVTFPRYSEYELKIFNEEECIGSQHYFVLKRNNLPKETKSEETLLNELKIKLEDKYDYNNDIPIFIQKDVEKMLQFSKNNK